MKAKSVEKVTPGVQTHVDSATESEGDEFALPNKSPPTAGPLASSPPARNVENPGRGSQKPRVSTVPSDSESASSPVRPAKKLKKSVVSSSSSDDDDSEAERKRRVAQLKSGNEPPGAKRGTKQPIKRGGKRF